MSTYKPAEGWDKNLWIVEIKGMNLFMARVVQKFGGTSVADPEKIMRAAKKAAAQTPLAMKLWLLSAQWVSRQTFW